MQRNERIIETNIIKNLKKNMKDAEHRDQLNCTVFQVTTGVSKFGSTGTLQLQLESSHFFQAIAINGVALTKIKLDYPTTFYHNSNNELNS